MKKLFFVAVGLVTLLIAVGLTAQSTKDTYVFRDEFVKIDTGSGNTATWEIDTTAGAGINIRTGAGVRGSALELFTGDIDNGMVRIQLPLKPFKMLKNHKTTVEAKILLNDSSQVDLLIGLADTTLTRTPFGTQLPGAYFLKNDGDTLLNWVSDSAAAAVADTTAIGYLTEQNKWVTLRLQYDPLPGFIYTYIDTGYGFDHQYTDTNVTTIPDSVDLSLVVALQAGASNSSDTLRLEYIEVTEERERIPGDLR